MTVPWSLSDQIMVSRLVSSAGTGFPARTLSLLTRRSQDRDELSACSAVPERGGSSTLSCLRWPHLTKGNPPPLCPCYLEKYLLMTQLQNNSGCNKLDVKKYIGNLDCSSMFCSNSPKPCDVMGFDHQKLNQFLYFHGPQSEANLQRIVISITIPI